MSETYVNYGIQLNNTEETSILVPPSGGTSLVKGIYISNTTSNSNLTININLYKNNDYYSIITNGVAPTGQSWQLLDVPIAIASGDSIKAQASASGVHIISSALELT
jgi:hypothetical protein